MPIPLNLGLPACIGHNYKKLYIIVLILLLQLICDSLGKLEKSELATYKGHIEVYFMLSTVGTSCTC